MTIRKVLNIMLATLLIVVTVYFGVATAVPAIKDLGFAFLIGYKRQIAADANLDEQLKARTSAFSAAMGTHMADKSTMQRLNAWIQKYMGKQVISYGASSMVTLPTGQLYDLMPDNAAVIKTRAATIAGLEQIYQQLNEKGIPMIYGYAHTGLYDGAELPDNVADDNNEIADDIVKRLTDIGIITIDSREVMRESGLSLDQIIFNTDSHWKPRAAFEMYSKLVDVLNDKTIIKADTSAADYNNFNSTVIPGAHISDIGFRLGAQVNPPDDFELITPKFDTDIVRDIMRNNKMELSEGAFEDVVLDKSMLPEAKGAKYANCYNYYGPHTEVVYYHNEAAPEGRLLIVKDSFGTPTSSFMSLAVRDVCAIDLRKTEFTVMQYVEEFKPDAVMFVQCQEVMRGANFVFVD